MTRAAILAVLGRLIGRAGGKGDRQKPRRAGANGAAKRSGTPPGGRRAGAAAARYALLVQEMTTRHSLTVKRWRTSMSGVAWMARSRGRQFRMIEAPYPKSPMSAAIFLHEVGHHAIGLGAVKPRCLEELAAWEWALRAMEEFGIEVTPRVRKRMDASLRYALAKAARRGLRRVPEPLARALRLPAEAARSELGENQTPQVRARPR